VEEYGLSIVREKPDVVVTYGGDGILLHSEREWPGVPKLPLRNSRRGKKCEPREVREAISKLAGGELLRHEVMKLRLEAKGLSQVGLNDVIVHNARPTSSLRCRVYLDNLEFGDEIVGDGIVVSTPFGSTAYYRSITRGIFHLGIGVAFNNSIEQVDHIVLREDAVIRIVITRGPAVVVADNHPELIDLDEDEDVVIHRAPEKAIILGVDWGGLSSPP
jgi:NAD+ kinase